MTKEEAISYLQQLYPNGGHCWLDEQRIEAIGMAINALQEEPVSEDLDEAVNNYVINARKGYPRVMDKTDKYVYDAFKAGAKWQKEKIKHIVDRIDVDDHNYEDLEDLYDALCEIVK